MMLFGLKRVWLELSICLGLTGVARSEVPANPGLTAAEIIHRAVARAQQVETRNDASAYSYRKVSVIEELDAAGKVKERKEKVYEVSYRGGSSWARLLQVNGHPPCRTDMKEQTENESNARHVLGRGNGEQNFLTPVLVGRFDFTLVGQTNLNGRLAYQLEFHPRNPEPPIRTVVDRLLNRLSGTIWIDTGEFELARAQLQLNSEVDLLWGVVGSLKKMTYTLIRARVGEGIWLNSCSTGNFEGRKLLDPMRVNLRTQNSDFRLLAHG